MWNFDVASLKAQAALVRARGWREGVGVLFCRLWWWGAPSVVRATRLPAA